MAVRSKTTWLIASALIAWTSPAYAGAVATSTDDVAPATPQVDQTDTSQDIIVTAQKRDQTLIQVPQAISVVSGATLEAHQATSLVDYAALVPGLTLQQESPGESRVILRGINTGGSSPTVAIYVDDVPFGSSTGQTNAAHLAGDIDPFDMQQIEVLKGPQGTLYGANSLGGLLKYVTNPAAASTRSRSAARRASRQWTAAVPAIRATASSTYRCRARSRCAPAASTARRPGYIDAIGQAGQEHQ